MTSTTARQADTSASNVNHAFTTNDKQHRVMGTSDENQAAAGQRGSYLPQLSPPAPDVPARERTFSSDTTNSQFPISHFPSESHFRTKERNQRWKSKTFINLLSITFVQPKQADFNTA